MPNMTFWTIYFRSLRLRCPACGKTKLFRGLFRMNPSCRHCQITFEREPGFFLGAIYFNYGLTAVLALMGFLVLTLTRWLPRTQTLWVTLAFTVIFPIWFFRYARSLWLGFDHFWDPRSANLDEP